LDRPAVGLRPGRLLPLYPIGYFSGRFWIEGLRVDPAHVIGGLRLNQWIALTVVMAASAYLVVDRYRNRRTAAPTDDVSQTVEHERAGGSVVG
jgi:prolipoprotein diacylglyceryltransferase